MIYAFCSLVILFLLTLFSYLAFWIGHVIPRAVRRWADSGRYRIIRREIGWPWEYEQVSGPGQRVYRIRVIDKLGAEKKGLLLVGKPYRLALSVSQCPIEVHWDRNELNPALATHQH